jgi:predicted Zn-dependent protease
LIVAGCASPSSTRELHTVNEALVRTPTAPWRAYEAYLRGVVAMESSPARPAEAQLQFRRAVTLDPDEVVLWVVFAEACFAIGDVVAGEEGLGRALALDPTDPRALAISSRERGAIPPAEVSDDQMTAPMSDAR